ncbi:MAG: sodium:proton antiporter [Hyphomicrobiales bacterium]
MLTLFEIIALILSISAVLSWVNSTFVKLPHTIGLLVMALATSFFLILLEALFPDLGLTDAVQSAIGQIDFFETVMNGMLAFLLFAGALHVNLNLMREQKWPIGLMATFGVVLSTFIVGTLFWLLAHLFGVPITYAWALVFGALISPTDPVAVLSLLKSISIPDSLEAKIAGESLFNDGVGVVVFTIIVAVAVGADGGNLDALHIAELFFVEAVGGAVLGMLVGYVVYRMMAAIDHDMVEILLTLGLVAGVYAVCLRLHLSGPIAVVVAGLFIGNRGAERAMSDDTREALFDFWEMIDEILNSVLFLLIGLEVLVISIDPSFAWIAVLSIPIVLFARLAAVSLPILTLSLGFAFSKGVIPVLTWGGVRGGISVALALSLPAVGAKPLIMTATYAVVIFSIVVQGLTIKEVVRRTVG